MAQLHGTNLGQTFKTRVIALVYHSQNKTKLVVSAGKTECVRNEAIGLDFVSSPMFALIGQSSLHVILGPMRELTEQAKTNTYLLSAEVNLNYLQTV